MDERKKTEKKKKRFAARLKNSKGINCVETAGPNLVLCNVGQATGFSKENLQQLLKDYGLDIEHPKLIAEKGESHSFLVFKSTDSAVSFCNTLNVKAKIDESGTPMYINYVLNVPNTEVICHHEDPKGLTVLENFITVEEEILFIKLFDWACEIDIESLKNRQVKHYGYEFRYGSNDVDLESPLLEKIPDECNVLWERLKECGYLLGVPDQLTVNKYTPGQGIPSHVDRHSPFGSTILSLSLNSSIVMEWKHHSGKHVPVVVPRRSLLIMQDEARYDWQHGIPARTYDPIIEHRQLNGYRTKVITSDTVCRQTRISLTFRWTRRGPCQCVYRTLCDSVTPTGPAELDDRLANDLEELHVHQVYEQIAGHFSATRHTTWPAVGAFLSRVSPGAVVLDLGAGNGKNVLPRGDILQIAGERSGGLSAECGAHVRSVRAAADCVRLDLLRCALRDQCADVAICVAVIHHFSTKARRLQAISTIHRLLRSSGVALITVWAKDQTRSNYLLKSKLNQPTGNVQMNVAGVTLHVHENRTQFQHQDLLVPWKLRQRNDNKLDNQTENTLLRYYHVFEEGELDELCREVGFELQRSYYEEGNWCVECKKV